MAEGTRGLSQNGKSQDHIHPLLLKILPPAKVIINLRDVINPDYWYVFPEEIE